MKKVQELRDKIAGLNTKLENLRTEKEARSEEAII